MTNQTESVVKVKKVYQIDGKKPFTVVDENGERYFSFALMDRLQEIRRGDDLILIVEPKPEYQGIKQFEIKGVREVKHNAYPKATTKPSEIPPSEGGNEVAPIPIPPSLSRSGIEERLRWAKKLVEDEMADSAEFVGAEIIAECMREDSAAAMSEFIQQSKERNIKAVKDSKGC